MIHTEWFTFAGRLAMVLAGLLLACLHADASPRIFTADAYGLAGDGETDDGPALARMADEAALHHGPVVLRFARGRTYRIIEAPRTWLFDFQGRSDIQIEGNDSIFVLHPARRFLHLDGCANVSVRDLAVDYDPLPYADGMVVGVDPERRWVDVRIRDADAMPPAAGPTGEREQAYFAMLWHRGRHDLESEHLFLRTVTEAEPGSAANRILRLHCREADRISARVQAGETLITVPIPGYAHRMEGYGASPVFVLHGNRNLLFDTVSLWCAPLFGVSIEANEGVCTFHRFDIRPRPGTGRLTSLWRDGFHVKANRASLLFDECVLEGMNDDAFNTASFSSHITEVVSSTRIRIRQNFPLGIVPWRAGDQITVYGLSARRLLGRARIVEQTGDAQTVYLNGHPTSPLLELELDTPITDMVVGDNVWNDSSANPDTLIRRCRIRMSCRLQSPVTLEDCDITALIWHYGENIEGPLPSRVVVKRCTIRQGRGNPYGAVILGPAYTDASGAIVEPVEPVIHDVILQDNVIAGQVHLSDVGNAVLERNQLQTDLGQIILRRCRNIALRGNLRDGLPYGIDAMQMDTGSRAALFPADPATRIGWPAAEWLGGTPSRLLRASAFGIDMRPQAVLTEPAGWRIRFHDTAPRWVLRETLPDGARAVRLATRVPAGGSGTLIVTSDSSEAPVARVHLRSGLMRHRIELPEGPFTLELQRGGETAGLSISALTYE